MKTNLKAMLSVFIFGLLAGCGGGGGDSSDNQVSVDPVGVYAKVSANGGPGYTVVDQPPVGQLFETETPTMFVVPKGSDRVMYLSTSTGILFVGNVTAKVDKQFGVGTMTASGTAYAATRLHGGKVTMSFANGLGVAPATLSGQFQSDGQLNAAQLIIQGHELQPITVNTGPGATPGKSSAPVTLAGVVGNYREADLLNAPPTRPLGTFTVDSAGNVSGTDPDGTFTGKIEIVDPNLVFQKITLSRTPTVGSPQTLSGVALFSPPYASLSTVLIDANAKFDFGWIRN